MYIVKQAVEKLNGTISLRSEYGTGTRIKINLPNETNKQSYDKT
jgi:chemotaxis protein histidine kinase CheA